MLCKWCGCETKNPSTKKGFEDCCDHCAAYLTSFTCDSCEKRVESLYKDSRVCEACYKELIDLISER